MTFLVWVNTSQNFAQTLQNVAPTHDGETVTFRNSAVGIRHISDPANLALLTWVPCTTQPG